MSASVQATKGFKFEDSKEAAQPKTVVGILPVDTFLVNYTDGEGKTQVRLAFKTKDSDAVFLLQEKIGGQPVATSANGWFNDAFNSKLQSLNLKKDGVESV